MEVEGCTHLEPLQRIFRSPSQIQWDKKRNLNLFLLPKKLQLEIEQEISIVRSLLQLSTFVSLLARHVCAQMMPFASYINARQRPLSPSKVAASLWYNFIGASPFQLYV